MCKAIEDMLENAKAQIRRDVARDMLKDNVLPVEEIAYYLDLPVEELIQIKAEYA